MWDFRHGFGVICVQALQALIGLNTGLGSRADVCAAYSRDLRWLLCCPNGSTAQKSQLRKKQLGSTYAFEVVIFDLINK